MWGQRYNYGKKGVLSLVEAICIYKEAQTRQLLNLFVGCHAVNACGTLAVDSHIIYKI